MSIDPSEALRAALGDSHDALAGHHGEVAHAGQAAGRALESARANAALNDPAPAAAAGSPPAVVPAGDRPAAGPE